MVKQLKTYFDFAENDYEYFMTSYEMGIVANQMGAIAQGICEKYMKHLADQYVHPDSAEDVMEKESILHTHNLNKLYKYLKRNLLDFAMDKSKLGSVDGFYFTTIYPGEESIVIEKEDIIDCLKAIQECRNSVQVYVKTCEVQKESNDIDLCLDLPAKPNKSKAGNI